MPRPITNPPNRTPVAVCARCNQPHVTRRGGVACTAHRTRRDPDGNLRPCSLPPRNGLTVCQIHGGSNRASRAKSARSELATAANRAVAIFGIPRQVDPAQGLIEEYWRAAGLVAAYERVVSGLPVDELVWGVVQRATTATMAPAGEGGTDGQDGAVETRTVAKGAVNVWVQMFNAERDRFAKLGVEIVRLGLEARRDEYIKAQVAVFASVLLAPELGLTPEQRSAAARLLRGLGQAGRVVEGASI